jgi:hypothetical protein
VFGITGWTYYVVVYLTLWPLLEENTALIIFVLLGYHLLLALMLLSYTKTIITDPGSIPILFAIKEIILDAMPEVSSTFYCLFFLLKTTKRTTHCRETNSRIRS